MSEVSSPVPASFRDPAGFVFRRQGRLYRQVNRAAQVDYDLLMASGLYERLVERGLLIPHREVDIEPPDPAVAYRIIEPETVPFLSWPFEWSFSQLKDAALATLTIQKLAIEHGLSLKDASAYNMQFHDGREVMIDTLSFERYREGGPWPAYRQFCQHFLAPLALMARRDIRLGQLLRVHIDGIPLDLAAQLLPRSTRFRPGLGMHLHLHARFQARHADTRGQDDGGRKSGGRVSRTGLLGLVEGLKNTVAKLDWKPGGTEWADYYSDTNYSDSAFQEKRAIVDEYLKALAPQGVWDLGANNGEFTRLATEMDIPSVAFDIDPSAVEANYRRVCADGAKGPLPLVMDLSNPSPALGWDERERESLIQRGPVDCVMALALIHHLAISNNVPLERIAAFLARIGRGVIIEWVPKSDSQVQRLLRSREDIFDNYHQGGFEDAVRQQFEIVERRQVAQSERWLYLLNRRGAQ